MKCRHGKKDWAGDEPKCAFDKNGKFLKNNWNCLLLDKLRANDGYSETWSEDSHCLVQPFNGAFIILSYYKHRGKTDGFWILAGDRMWKGTEKDAKEYLKWTDEQ